MAEIIVTSFDAGVDEEPTGPAGGGCYELCAAACSCVTRNKNYNAAVD